MLLSGSEDVRRDLGHPAATLTIDPFDKATAPALSLLIGALDRLTLQCLSEASSRVVRPPLRHLRLEIHRRPPVSRGIRIRAVPQISDHCLQAIALTGQVAQAVADGREPTLDRCRLRLQSPLEAIERLQLRLRNRLLEDRCIRPEDRLQLPTARLDLGAGQ